MRKATTRKATKVAAPVPVKSESRNCFGIAYYATEAEANEADRLGRETKVTYNGGFFHDKSCGRDKAWDHTDSTTGQKLYACTN